MAKLNVRDLLDAGLHYGHRVSRWNPKMRPYIHGKRNLIHIIDLRETMRGLITANRFVRRIVAGGKDILFVGTKRHARGTIKAEALRCKMHFVNDRWLGGTLTNFRYIRSRLNRLFDLEELFESGTIYNYTKKEASLLRRERNKIHRNLEGIRNMEELPGAVFIIDPRRERIAVAECHRLGIPRICLADTDCDPDSADIIIPGNDDAMRSVEIVTRHIADAALDGLKRRGEQRPMQVMDRSKTPAPKTAAPAAETPAKAPSEAAATPTEAQPEAGAQTPADAAEAAKQN